MKRPSNNMIAVFIILHILLNIFVISFSFLKADELTNVYALSNSAQGTVRLNVREKAVSTPAPAPSAGITDSPQPPAIPITPPAIPEKPAVEKPTIITARPVVEFPPGAVIIARPIALTSSLVVIGLVLFIINLKFRIRRYTLRNEKIEGYFKE